MSNRNISPNYDHMYKLYDEPYKACLSYRDQEFAVWKSQVDDMLMKNYGKSSVDLVDRPYKYYFSLGKSPAFIISTF